MSSEPLTHEDMYIIGDTAMKKNDYGLAAQWLYMSTRNIDSDFPKADAYLQLSRAQKEVWMTL